MLLFFIIIPSLNLILAQRNPNFNVTANSFIQQYYQQFDSPASRTNLKAFYDQSDSTLSINGEVILGANGIYDKLNNLPKLNNRRFTTIDNQPKIDGGWISEIFGRIQFDNGTVVWCSEMLVLTPKSTGYYIQNQNLRMVNGYVSNGPTVLANGGSFVFASLSGINNGISVVGPANTGSASTLKFSG